MLFRSNDTATTEIYTRYNTLSLHDALPIYVERALELAGRAVVLSEGRVTLDGRVDDVRDVASTMVGPLRDVLGS